MRSVLFSPRWWGVHLLVVVAVLVQLRLGLWQWHRSQSPTGGIQNYAYAFQWPLFAVFTLVLWWKTVRIEAAKLTGLDVPALSSRLAADPLPAAAIEHRDGVRVGLRTAIPTQDVDDDEVALYNAYLARLNASVPAARQGG